MTPTLSEAIRNLAQVERQWHNARLAVEYAVERGDIKSGLYRARDEAAQARDSAILRLLLASNVDMEVAHVAD